MELGAISNAAELVASIEASIVSGELTPGDRLDPVRALAAQLGLAPATVASAYRTLGDRGYVVGQGRRGTFVAAGPALVHPGDDPIPANLIDLADGNPAPDLLPPLGPALAELPAEHVLYGASGLDPALAPLLRSELERDGVPSDHLAVVSGALDGIERVLGAHVRPGDSVAVEDPGYSSVAELVRALGLRPVAVPIDGAGLVPAALEQAVAGGCRAVVITPRAHNPTGAALDRQRAADLAGVTATAPGLLVIVDDHAGPVSGQPYWHPVGPSEQSWAMIRSVAKSLGPDLRLASVAGDPTTISRLVGRQVVGPGWVSHLLQRLAAILLADPGVLRQLDEASEIYRRRRAVVVDRLRAAGLDVESRSGFNVWIPVDDEARVVAGMERRGYAIRSGSRYRLASGPGVRVSIAGAAEAQLEEAADALVEVLAAPQRARTV